MHTALNLILFVLAGLVPAKHALHVFQQNSYINSRYLEWLRENAVLRLKAAMIPIR